MSLRLRPEAAESAAHPSRHALARHHAGEGEPGARAALAAHLAACPECRQVVEELQGWREAFQAEWPRARLGEALAARAARAPVRPSWWRLAWRPLAWGALTAAAVAVLTMALPEREPAGQGGARIKGSELALGFFLEQAGQAVPVAPDHALRAGDRIQFRLTAPAGGYLHLVGVDSAGQVSVYHPPPQGSAWLFPGGAGKPVPGSVLLDASPGPERVFALLCDAPRDPASLAAAVRALDPDPRVWLDRDSLPPMPTCLQVSLLLRKE